MIRGELRTRGAEDTSDLLEIDILEGKAVSLFGVCRLSPSPCLKGLRRERPWRPVMTHLVLGRPNC